MSLAVSQILKTNTTLSLDSPQKEYNDDLLQVFKAYSFSQVDFPDYAKPGESLQICEERMWLKVTTECSRSRFRNLRTVAAQVNFMLDHNYSPHLTRLHEVRAEQVEFNEICPTYSKYKLLTLMEKLEGNLERRTFSTKEMAAFAIQIAFTEAIAVERVHLCPRDRKLRNILWKRIDVQDTFNGQKLQDFDYWRYKIADDEFFIPRLDYLVKFCDYDLWDPMVSETQAARYDNTEVQSPKECLEAWLSGVTDISLAEAKLLFPTPQEAHPKVLDIIIDREELNTPFGNHQGGFRNMTELLQEIPFRKPSINKPS